jgi:uncharacterized protein
MWFTAFILGLFGSLHCLGMCSPLVMAVTSIRTPYFGNRLLYNAMRIASYGIQGAIISVFGSLFNFSQFQVAFSVALGSVLILLGFAGITHFKIPLVSKAMQKFTTLIKFLFTSALSKKTMLSIGITGFLNGLLPCGLTYLALSYCVILPKSYQGFFFMLFFGLGTMPVMLGFTTLMLGAIKIPTIRFQKLTQVFLIMVGLLLVYRSLSSNGNHQMSKVESAVICK